MTPTGTLGERPLQRMHPLPAGIVPSWSRLRSRAARREQRFEDSKVFQHASIRFLVPYTGGPRWSVLVQ
jgi:hypothetical protein